MRARQRFAPFYNVLHVYAAGLYYMFMLPVKNSHDVIFCPQLTCPSLSVQNLHPPCVTLSQSGRDLPDSRTESALFESPLVSRSIASARAAECTSSVRRVYTVRRLVHIHDFKNAYAHLDGTALNAHVSIADSFLSVLSFALPVYLSLPRSLLAPFPPCSLPRSLAPSLARLLARPLARSPPRSLRPPFPCCSLTLALPSPPAPPPPSLSLSSPPSPPPSPSPYDIIISANYYPVNNMFSRRVRRSGQSCRAGSASPASGSSSGTSPASATTARHASASSSPPANTHTHNPPLFQRTHASSLEPAAAAAAAAAAASAASAAAAAAGGGRGAEAL